jgi:hypothetical protein
MCCSISFFVLVFFNSPTFPPIKQGLSDVLLFVISRVRVFFNSTYPPTYEAGLSDVLLFDVTCWSIFQQSYPPTYESRD